MDQREAVVTLMRPGAEQTIRLASFTTVRKAEQYIGQCERHDPEGVHRGDYGIDASERADAEYQRLKRRA
jgi:hypothetical protein